MHFISKRYFNNGETVPAGIALRFLYLASLLKIAEGGYVHIEIVNTISLSLG